jgi:outer membrane protein TolC
MPASGPTGVARSAETAAARNGLQPMVSEKPLPDPLTIDACIGWTLEHNRDLRSQISSAERSRLDVTVAHSTVYSPRLTASGRRQLSTNADGTVAEDTAAATVALTTNVLGFTVAPYAVGSWSEADGLADNTPYNRAVGIAVSRRIFALAEDARLSAPLTNADRAYAQGVNSLTLRTRRIALDAARTFFDLQRAETRIRLRESRLEQTKLFLTGVRESVAAGLKAPIEETNALIDFNQAEANLLSDRQSVANARDRLLSLLDRPLGGEVNLTASDVTAVKPDLPPLQDDIDRVLAGHEDILNLRISMDQARDDTLIARDRLAPQVTATASVSRGWEASGATDGAAEPDDVLALKVEVEMPLDGWTGERAAYYQQQRQERELRIRMRSLQIDLERQVRELRRGIEVQVRTVDLNEKRLEAERSKFAATEASYRTGRVDNLELTRARETLDTAEVNLLESRIDLVLALAGRDALLPPAEQR